MYGSKIDRIFAVLTLCCLSFLIPARVLGATTIAADGAVGANADWEAGKVSTWYIELQRAGADYIQAGAQQENETLIQQGVLIFNWGFAHQGSDGSFPGTGDAFHSTSLFVEAVARATLLLKAYHPVTYTYNASYYTSLVSSYTSKVRAAARWLIQPAIASKGQQYNLPYTHRRYLLAAALGQTAKLAGDSTLASAAVPYVLDGLSLQWTNGVNPELGGYDVAYQCAGIVYAAHYDAVCTDTTLQSRLRNMMQLGLQWEMTKIDVQGNVDITGSTRVGQELNRDGTLKQPTLSNIADAFFSGYKYTSDRRFQVVGTRVDQRNATVSNQPVSSTGAVGNNIKWELGTATTWALGLQKAGADWIQAGIDRENETLIQQGIKIFDWGFARQASDGSFPGTSSAFYNVAQFVEAVSRATLLLKAYHPVTYTYNASYYTSLVSKYSQKLEAAARWLTKPDIATAGQKSDLPYTSHRWLMTAALSQTARLTGDSAVASAAVPYALDGLSLQWSNGINPEKGTYDVNYQAQGILYAERYFPLCADSTLQSRIQSMIILGLQWEMTRVNVQGDVNTGTSQGASYPSIIQAFKLGYDLTLLPKFQVVWARIDANH